MKAADLMTRDVITVGPEATLREVASVLVTEHIGGVPVVAGESVLGVVSATDLLEFDADAPGSPAERPEAVEGPGEAPGTLEEEVERGDEAAAAYFTDFWEDAGAELVERFDRLESPEWNVLDEHVASEVMSEVVFSLPPDTGVREAARRMLEADVHRALVVEEGALLGVLTTLDILRAVARHGLATESPRPARA